MQQYQTARKIIALREICSIFWQLRCIKEQRLHESAQPLIVKDEVLEDGIQRLGFKLSEFQQQALVQIRAGLAHNTPSMQLIQGDVACGKTALAFLAAWICLKQKTF